MDIVWMIGQSLLNGLTMGGIYALLSVGLTIIFGVMKVVNFAQGEYLTIGMYITLVLYQMTGLDPYVLLIPAIVIAYFIGMLSFKTIVRPLLGQSGSNFIVATMGLSFVIQSVLQIIFTSEFQSVDSFVRNKSLVMGDFAIAWPRVIACGCMIVFVWLIDFFLTRPIWGARCARLQKTRRLRRVWESIQPISSVLRLPWERLLRRLPDFFCRRCILSILPSAQISNPSPWRLSLWAALATSRARLSPG